MNSCLNECLTCVKLFCLRAVYAVGNITRPHNLHIIEARSHEHEAGIVITTLEMTVYVVFLISNPLCMGKAMDNVLLPPRGDYHHADVVKLYPNLGCTQNKAINPYKAYINLAPIDDR